MLRQSPVKPVPVVVEPQEQSYTIAGVKIQFPFRAYPSQVQLMQQAQVERFTSLAWRDYERNRQMDEWRKNKEEAARRKREAKVAKDKTVEKKSKYFDSGPPSPKRQKREHVAIKITSDDEDFQAQTAPAKSRVKAKPDKKTDVKDKNEGKAKPVVDDKPKIRLPKIYFASRTQKQLSQVVKELKHNTIYRPKVAVLGSRQHFCINPKALKAQDVNRACEELNHLDNCRFFHGVRTLRTLRSLWRGGEKFIWDIEDLMELGTKQKGCPYYTSRALVEEADIVFCPHNYVIDPLIREPVDFNVEDSVIIFDEAHVRIDFSGPVSAF
ncbi:hypothetical protein M427DRAFT_30596 [Gonapodya prolifera JEL478]|uniref:Helicase ATP-binding domain-containing protein n=1 Tax=Gonapodya prolifera (strain JEL478) TaxID=1344416 RepID=A0A139AK82_GONPJ|nr:hypothetical protein M427DRAFT_30596 [Gonapodya prolifera JEL478]|eukprot:KXS17118.1 hypothetical protein M427DRAFT_30596 [Gonapodya prolifera JEL478]